ncbi:JmjC domain-containing protein [uncultured Streptomyces sp.]|uniref:JmjC domain-containing protein n=1 Tax=uncultured Streptomyces sp. TaxID=174707 RepID=UPI00262BFCB7|nr:cupin domain-containing protein [uncultured Streptomyces sp.]
MSTANVLPAPLREELLGEETWGRSHRVVRNAVDPSLLLSSADIGARLDASLLKWPYFTLLKSGEAPAPSSYTTVRDVIGHKVGGFADAAAIRRHMAAGASLKLNQVADWHRPTRDLARTLEQQTDCAANSYIFWTPEAQQGMLPHRDAAHVLAIQVEGRKEWHLHASPEQIGARAGLDVDSSAPTHVFTMEPGDVLYLPHGWPHDAVALDGGSLHLTFTLTGPTPEDLVDAVLRRFLQDEEDLVHHFHTRPLDARTAEVRAALARTVGDLDGGAWTRTALDSMRKAIS